MTAPAYPEGHGASGSAAMLASGSRAEGLRNLQVPTLVIHGLDDTLIAPSGGERTAELVPDARLMLVTDMGHDRSRCGRSWSGRSSSTPPALRKFAAPIAAVIAAGATAALAAGFAGAAQAATYYRLVQYPSAGFAGFYAQINAAKRSIDVEIYELEDYHGRARPRARGRARCNGQGAARP